MTQLANRSSNRMPPYFNDLAASTSDSVQLVGRALLGSLFLLFGWSKLTTPAFFVAYFTALKMPYPEIWPWLAGGAEILIGLALIAGLAIRYAALVSFVFVIITTVIAHRYWEYPAAQQFAQYTNFLKNLAIMGGCLSIFVNGGGRWSVDKWLTKRRS